MCYKSSNLTERMIGYVVLGQFNQPIPLLIDHPILIDSSWDFLTICLDFARKRLSLNLDKYPKVGGNLDRTQSILVNLFNSRGD